MGTEPVNCNHCSYREEVSRYFDLEDYCSRNMKCISRIDMGMDCPLREDGHRGTMGVLKLLHGKKKLQYKRKLQYKAEDMVQMDTDITLTGKDGKFIRVKVPEPEYMDSIW